MKISAATLRTPVAGDMVSLAGTGGLTTAFKAYLQPATEALPGLIELATTAEAQAGTDTGRAVTPAGLKEYFNQQITMGASGGFDWTLARTGGGTYRLDLGGSEFDGTFDDTAILAFNMTTGGARIATDKAGFGIFMEYDYYNGGNHQSEWQVRFVTETGTAYRPVQFLAIWDFSQAYWDFIIGATGNSFFVVKNSASTEWLRINYLGYFYIQQILYFRAADSAFLGTENNADLYLITNNTRRICVPKEVDGFRFGVDEDTNLYRSAANTLKTDDDLLFTGSLGPILADRSDGHTYRIKVTAGTLGTEVVT